MTKHSTDNTRHISMGNHVCSDKKRASFTVIHHVIDLFARHLKNQFSFSCCSSSTINLIIYAVKSGISGKLHEIHTCL